MPRDAKALLVIAVIAVVAVIIARKIPTVKGMLGVAENGTTTA
jgi:hypothetical protein